MVNAVTDEPTDDQEIDGTEDPHDVDIEEDTDHTTATPLPDIDPEIEQEIKKVIVEEESPAKKAHILPNDLINRELSPDDLFDDGSI